MSIADKISALNDAKNDIASAIVAKGGTVTGGFSSFAEDISNLPSGGGLPSSFKQLDYVVSTGYQYLDTGIFPDINARFEFKFEFTTPITSDRRIMGTAENYSSKKFDMIMWSNNWYFNFGNGSSNAIPFDSSVTDYTFSFDGTSLWINGVEGKSLNTATSLNSSYSLRLLGYYSSSYYQKGKLKSFKYWNGDTLIMELIPCYNIITGKNGMFDIIGYVFYTSATSTPFERGNEI